MTASWQITDLSIVDADGSYVTTISEAVTPVVVALDADEAIDSATAELFRIKHDHEITGPTVEPWEAIEGVTVEDAGTVATVSITGHVRHETYILVVTFDATAGEPFTRTRILDCVA